MKHYPAIKRTVSALLVLLLIVPASVAIFPKKAEAQWAVIDLTNIIQTTATALATAGLNTKEYILDTVVTLAAKAAIAAIHRSTLNWINSGFQGSPAFVTNLKANLLLVGDTYADKFFDELATGMVNSPHQQLMVTAVRTGYFLSTGGSFSIRNPFTLDQYSSNPQAFLGGDFNQGGLNAWYAVVTNQQNNPYGAYSAAMGELNSRLASSQGREVKLWDWGNGYKSVRNCSGPQLDSVQLGQIDTCLDAPLTLMGANIADQVNKTLGYPQDALVSADEINELLGALFTQLVSKALSSTGLIGLTKPSSGGGRSYIDDATDPKNTSTLTNPSSVGPSGTAGSGTNGNGTVTPAAPSSTIVTTDTDLNAYIASLTSIKTAAQDALKRCKSSSVASNILMVMNATLQDANTALVNLKRYGPQAGMYTNIAPTVQQVQNAANEASGKPGTFMDQAKAVASC